MTDTNGRRPGVADSADARGKAVRFAWQRDAVEDAVAEPVRRTSSPVRARTPTPPEARQAELSKQEEKTSFYPSVTESANGTPATDAKRPSGTKPAADAKPAATGRHRGADQERTAEAVAEQQRQEAAQRRKERNERAFAVPPPGGRLAHGRGGHLAVRVAIAMTACLLLLGCAFIFGLLANRVGKSDNTASVTAGDLSKFHVDEFPLQSAAAVAQRYTRLCLNATPSGADDRNKQLRSIVSGDVGDDCGWNGRGKIKATDITWTGQADPMPQQGAKGRYLHMQAVLNDGDLIQFIVPVYASDPAHGTGVRVAGAPGILPGDAAPSPKDAISDDADRDTGLAQRLMTNVLPGFFTAWGESSSADLDRYRTPDATNNIRSGMSKVLSNPEVQDVTVPLPDEGLGSSHTWESGDVATVQSTVRWDLSGSAQITLGYRLTMVRNTTTASGWSIKDIAGGLPDSSLSSSLQDSTMPTSLSILPSSDKDVTEPVDAPRKSSSNRVLSASAAQPITLQ